MNVYRLSRKATVDLDEIWDYTAERWDEGQAERYINGVRAVLDKISARPRLGRPVDSSKNNLFRISANAHIVFYRIVRDEVLIIRILHKRMDFDRHL